MTLPQPFINAPPGAPKSNAPGGVHRGRLFGLTAATGGEKTDGTEIAILDCIGFLRHFLHLFHRIRADYLNAYQTLVLNEPDSAVSQTLKEAFLALRQAAESGE